ncbi:MAG: uroporphyrinogen-III synthase [Pseudomonadota bacterium]|nr:uroporphyrinogen-III synthase [Pseudomonadota bacterium]
MNLPLAGLGVLVTRPAHQASGFIHLLQQAGATTFALPCMEIQPLAPDENTRYRLQQSNSYQIVIFISANAVRHGLPLLQKQSAQQIAAIGEGSARALREQGREVDIVADSGFRSEDLLALPAMQSDVISGKNILIIRGRGGREVLAETLRARGAKVDYAEVYQRSRPQTDAKWLTNLWRQPMQLVCVTSNEMLENLYHMLHEFHNQLLNTQLLVPSTRCYQLAQRLGFKHIIQAESATDNNMLNRIMTWHQTGV